jgi:hypothetical protein
MEFLDLWAVNASFGEQSLEARRSASGNETSCGQVFKSAASQQVIILKPLGLLVCDEVSVIVRASTTVRRAGSAGPWAMFFRQVREASCSYQRERVVQVVGKEVGCAINSGKSGDEKVVAGWHVVGWRRRRVG